MFDTTHAHITTWVIGLILFVVALGLLKGGNAKGAKIVVSELDRIARRDGEERSSALIK